MLDHGVHVSGAYTGEFAANPIGGQREGGSTYADQAWITTQLDMDKIAGIRGGILFATMTNRNGANLAASHINNSVSVQQVYGGGQTYQLTQLAWDQALDDDRYEIQAGRISLGDEFLTSPFYCDFQSNSICGNPSVLGQDTNFTWWPIPTWGSRGLVNITPNLVAKAGVYEAVDSAYIADPHHGFAWGTNHGDGLLIPASIQYHTDFSNDPYPMSVTLGNVHSTSEYQDAAGNPHDGRDLIYLQADKLLWKPYADAKRGLYAFGMAGFGTAATQKVAFNLLGGLVQQGTFEGRPLDRIGFAVDWTRFNKDQVGVVAQNEPDNIAMELNYAWAITPAVELQPGIQYLVHPDGGGSLAPPPSGHIDNAVVVGLQLTIHPFDMLGMPSSPIVRN